jgi:UDP-N-acetylmuramoyl-L-alanyl-D-glutamate--2,6-diaminopimelate ligase
MNPRPVDLRSILTDSRVPYSAIGSLAVPIAGIAIDSRKVKAGDLFVCLQGGSLDGHQFIPQAVSKGAAAVVGQQALRDLSVPYARVSNTREALSWIAAAFYGFPGRQLVVIGVTGTDGKTTTTNLIYQILAAAGIRAGMISSVNAVIADEVLDTGFHVTTPDAHDVQGYLARMVEAGLTHVVLETTSHGWAQHRVDACEFDVGVVTNITHEHLDEHGSYENYRAAKARLFESLGHTLPKRYGIRPLAVLNRDDSSYDFLRQTTHVDCISYGTQETADYRASRIAVSPAGIQFTAEGPNLRVVITSSLIGEYNVSNCLAALAVAIRGLGLDPALAVKGISSLQGVSGRMERIDLGQDFIAIVDFAHTPNALKVALQSARKMLPAQGGGRVIAVFGSAGLRDKAKRRMMAEIATDLADLSVLTAEDPRTESLDGILEDMAVGARSRGGREGETFWRIRDRGEAIKLALHLAQPHDIVLSCGKGHEQSMCFGAVEYAWDDRIAMRAGLADLLGRAGPSMPYLPTQEYGG